VKEIMQMPSQKKNDWLLNIHILKKNPTSG
jgi:hypothetical protein